MIKEYPAKHAEYSVVLQEKERQRITEHYKEYSVSTEASTLKYWATGTFGGGGRVMFSKDMDDFNCNNFVLANATTEYSESWSQQSAWVY
jgi:hypothetical protein